MTATVTFRHVRTTIPTESYSNSGLVAEYGLRSFETLRDWALWALDHLGETTPADP